MIQKFPEFKKLELTDKEEVEKFTSEFPPYSDFNFTTLWIWNIDDKITISELNNNLIIVFCDYLSGKSFISFIGKNKISETISELIKFSEKKYQTPFLKLIPEEVVNVISKSMFKIEPDRDSYEYIYSSASLANMNNWSQNTSGKNIRRFIKSNPSYSVKQFTIENLPKEEFKKIFKEWAENKNIDNHFELNEYKAFERLLQIKNTNIGFLALYINNILVGFTVYEIISNDFIISHFAKTIIAHNKTIHDILNWEEAKLLNKKGIKYFNWEEDLGMKNLRYSKEKYKCSSFLKKFIVGNLT